jgi:hypothetical protein
MKTNVLQKLSSLGTRSKNLLIQFRDNLRRDWDRRNFDSLVRNILKRYCKPFWKKELSSTIRYLWNLKSSKDGKAYSQGVKEYSKLRENALKFAQANHAYFGWNVNYNAAKQMLIDQFSKYRLSPLNYRSDADIEEALPKKDTHAGFTYIETGVKEKGKNLENILARFNTRLQQALKDGSFNTPILPAVRTQGKGHAFTEDGKQTGDCDHKTRMVSIVDLFTIIAELKFAKPFQDLMATIPWYAGGKNLDSEVASTINGYRHKHNFWTSLDYSNFDASVSAWLIHDAFDVIRSAFIDLSDEEEAVFKLVEHDFIEKDFILADEIIHSVRGVPSGSMFTQIVDSIANWIVIQTYLNSKHLRGDMEIMGDDNLVYTDVELNLLDLSSYVRKNFGMEINPSKTEHGLSTTAPTFLSCEWRVEGRYREPHELIAKLLYPERERNYKSGDATPEEVVWSYILSYGLGMREFFNVDQFLADNPRLRRVNLQNMGSRELPGLLKYLRDYTGGYWSRNKPKAA